MDHLHLFIYCFSLLSVVYCVHEAPRGLPEAASMVRCRYGMVQLLGGTVQILREIKYPSGKITVMHFPLAYNKT
jgi:hypothetical protein